MRTVTFMLLAVALTLSASFAGAAQVLPTDPDRGIGFTAPPEVSDLGGGGPRANNIQNVRTGTYYDSFTAAIADAQADDILEVVADPLVTTETQIVVSKSLTIRGQAGGEIVRPSANTGGSGDARGWFLVTAADVEFRNLEFDGSGYDINQGLRFLASGGTVANCVVHDIAYPGYNGLAIVGFDELSVIDCQLSDIGRVGVILFGTDVSAGLVSGLEYAGKGAGDWLDYGIELGGGAVATLQNNTISECRGVASSDGSTSACVLITTYFGAGTSGTLHGNVLGNSTGAVAVGYDEFDASTVTAYSNDMSGNDSFAIGNTNPTHLLNAYSNWYGSADPIAVAALLDAGIDYTPWLDSGTDISVDAGFQGDFSTLWVDDDSPQTGATGRIAEGISLVTGSTVNVAPGTYAERLNVSKVVALHGAQYGVDPTLPGSRTDPLAESKITEAGLTTPNPDVLIEVPAGINGVTIDGFTLEGDPTNPTADTSVLRSWANNLTVSNNIITGRFAVLLKQGSNLAITQNHITTNTTGVTIQPNPASNVTISGNLFAIGSTPVSDAQAIYMANVTDALVASNTASGFVNSNGVGGSNNTRLTIRENQLTNLRKGVNLWGNTTFVTVTDNVISSCSLIGVNIKGQDISVTGNAITGNGIGVSIDKHTLTTLRVAINDNDLSGNTTLGLEVTAAVDPELVNASGNWWGSNDPATVRARADGGGADYTPWLDTGTDTDPAIGFQGDFSDLWVDDDSPQSGATNLIQEAINAVSGSTIYLAPGTYTGAITINKNLTLEGSGNGTDPATSSILNGGGAVAITLTAGGSSSSDRLILRNFRVLGGTNGIRTDVAIAHVMLEDLVVTGNSSYGVEIHNSASIDDLVLDGCSFVGQTGNNLGMRIRGSVTALRASDCHFDSNGYGIQSVNSCGDGTVLDDVAFTNCTFSNNTYKGAYFEKLSHATFTDCVVENNGTLPSYPAGIDVNLKFANYSDINFIRLRMSNCGAADPATGAGFAIKGRNDGSYSTCPGSLSDVTLQDVSVTGCPTGVSVGNAVTGVVVSSSCIYDNTVAGLVNWTDGSEVIDADWCWWGSASGPYNPTSNPSGTGNAVSDRVLFAPWSTGNLVFIPEPVEISVADVSYQDFANVHYLGGGSAPLYGYSIDVQWNVTYATYVSATRPATGPFATAELFQVVNLGAGHKRIDCALGGANPGTDGPADLCKITWQGAACTPSLEDLTLTINYMRDSGNAEITGIVAADGSLLVDLGVPEITAAAITRTILPNTGYVKDGDTVTLAATVTDGCSEIALDDITADLTALGGGAAVVPTTYDGTTATWSGIVITGVASDGDKTVAITATDDLGNSTTLDPAASVYVDNTPPDPVTAMSAAPGHNKCVLTWTNPSGDPDLDTYGIMIRRTGWGDYPLYATAPPEYPSATAGTEVYNTPGMMATYTETFASTGAQRDICYYRAFVFDKAYNFSAPADGDADRATNYWLGDVSPSAWPESIGDGSVATGDISALSSVYYADPLTNAHCDVGPTDDHSRLGIPTPDGRADFEDLMIFSMNFGVVHPLTVPPLALPDVATEGEVALSIALPEAMSPGSEFEARVMLADETGVTQGVKFAVTYDPAALEYLGAHAGSLLQGVANAFFMPVMVAGQPEISVAALGEGVTFGHSGELATLRFRCVGQGGLAIGLRDMVARNVLNEDLLTSTSDVVENPVAVKLPATVFLRAAQPNPLTGATTIAYGLPKAARVQLAVYDVGGRLVRVLAAGMQAAGEHPVVWDGRDGAGNRVANGLYLYRLDTEAKTITRKLIVTE